MSTPPPAAACPGRRRPAGEGRIADRLRAGAGRPLWDLLPPDPLCLLDAPTGACARARPGLSPARPR
ncbi:hypothetical protein [Kitasatospora griseola]|uniref:hypothetical protein n=1 Tax=Kitasatospora griseola TaxID=2064 RepID=UPI003823C2F3